MKFEALGDCGWIVRDLTDPPYLAAERLRRSNLNGLIDAAASYDSVGVFCRPGSLDEDALSEALGLECILPEEASRLHQIPVCYEMGEDLAEVCNALRLSTQELKELHQSQDYECFAVGFCPGFGYLGWLPDGLAGVPRRKTPRIRVEAGSVGITGRQTAVYPLARPGGWALIGQTPLTLVNVEESYFPITAGDRVRFYSIGVEEYEGLVGSRL